MAGSDEGWIIPLGYWDSLVCCRDRGRLGYTGLASAWYKFFWKAYVYVWTDYA